MKTGYIVQQVRDHFTQVYKTAGSFVDSGELWDFCMDVLKDPVAMSQIAFANDLGVPPVRGLLLLWEREKNPAPDFAFQDQQSQHMGALMGFVFKFVLGYQDQKDRCRVQRYGVRTAARFLNGPAVSFEP